MAARGQCLLEILLVGTLLIVLAGAAAPLMTSARHTVRARAAVDHLASQLHRARLEALKRQANVAIRFEPAGSDFAYAMYVDGNGNGVRTQDITDGVDRALQPPELLSQQYPGVAFALEAGIPAIETSDQTRDSVRVGRSRMLSFSPAGTSSSGTVYIRGTGPHQLAVRVLGPTGRIRTFEFHRGSQAWLLR